MWWTHMGWAEMLFGALMMLLFWGGLIVLVWFIARSFVGTGGRRQDARSPDTALDILKERYARGEISKAEYEEMRRDIER
jgi:putative membrane protein